MADEREAFPAFHALPANGRAFLATVEQAIGPGATSAAISKAVFAARGGIGRGHSWSIAKTRLIRLKFITVEPGIPNGCAKTANIYSLSDGWRDIGEAEARQLMKVERRRAPRTVWLLRFLTRAADNGNAEARRLLRKHIHSPDPFALARIARVRPELFEKAYPRGKTKQRRRRSFEDDHVVRRLTAARLR